MKKKILNNRLPQHQDRDLNRREPQRQRARSWVTALSMNNIAHFVEQRRFIVVPWTPIELQNGYLYVWRRSRCNSQVHREGYLWPSITSADSQHSTLWPLNCCSFRQKKSKKKSVKTTSYPPMLSDSHRPPGGSWLLTHSLSRSLARWRWCCVPDGLRPGGGWKKK